MGKWYEERFEPKEGRNEVRCEVCERSMWLPASKVSMYRTCSPECRANRTAAVLASRARPCETCGAAFVPRPRQLQMGQGRFCSQACNTAAREAMQSAEAQQRARASRSASLAAGRWSFPRGPQNPRWNGGRAAAIARRAPLAAEYAKWYRKANPEKMRARRQARRGGRGKLPADIVSQLLKLQRGRCAICRTSVHKESHIDHIIPIARGGMNVRSNVQLLCPPCNRHKSAKDPVEYMQSRGFLL